MNAISILKKYYGWLILSLVACVLIAAGLGTYLKLSSFELLHLPSGSHETISLPLGRESLPGAGTYELRGKFTLGWITRVLHITPDDEVKQIIINGHEVDLSVVPAERLNDWVNGFSLNVSPYVTSGENSIIIVFDDYGGNLGMKIGLQYGGWRMILLTLLLLALALVVIIKSQTALKISKLHSVLYCLIILGAILRIGTIYTYNPMDHIGTDPERHWEQGKDPLRNDLMSNTDPIMFQLYIATIAKTALGIPSLVAFYTSLLSLIGPWLWYRFFREVQSDKTLALAGWAFLALLPSWISIYTYFMQETLLLPLLGAALWATWRARRKATVESFAWMIVLWILAGLTRGIVIPIAAVCCTALWMTQQHKLKKALVSLGILALGLGPLTYRAYQTVHHFAPHGMGHLVAIYAMSGKQEIIMTQLEDGVPVSTFGFGSPTIGEKPFKPFSDWESRRKGQIHVRIDLGKGMEDWNRGFEQTGMTWRDAMWITKENIIYLFFGPSWPDNNDERLLDLINIHARWIWPLALLAALGGIFMQRRRLTRQWLLPSMILAWFVVQGVLPISVNEGRYRKPFEGLIVAQLILLAAASRGLARAGAPYTLDIPPHIQALVSRLRRKISKEKIPAALPVAGNQTQT
jgi:hypothetical protein